MFYYLVLIHFVCVCADCSVEVLAKVKGIGCIGYKAGFAFHCFGSVYTSVSSCLALDIRTEKDSRCLCGDCLGWCCLLSDVIYACKSCKCLASDGIYAYYLPNVR